jgi:hypothetical protein
MASITGIYYGLDEPKLTLMREQAFAQIASGGANVMKNRRFENQ